jgi:hypothetical protein
MIARGYFRQATPPPELQAAKPPDKPKKVAK